MNRTSPRHIAIIQLARLGDLIQTLPAIRALKLREPDARVTLVHDARYSGLVGRLPEIDAAYSFDVADFLDSPAEQILSADRFRSMVRWLQPLRQTPFDVVCNFNFAVSASILASILPGGRRLGYHYDPRLKRILHSGWFTYLLALAGHRRRNGFNLVELFTRGVGGAPEPRTLFAPHPSKKLTGRIGIQIGASVDKKRWPEEYLARLAGRIVRELGRRVVLLGSPEETHTVRRVRDLAGGGEVVEAETLTALADLPDLFDNLDLLITPDTGPMHLAAWHGLPTLALFTGSSYYVETSPWTENTVILQSWTKRNPCSDAGACCNGLECHRSLTPELVFDVLREQLARVEEGGDFAQIVHRVSAPPGSLLVVPTLRGGTFGYDVEGLESETLERDFFKLFWISVLGPGGLPLPHRLEGPRAEVETLQTAQLLFSSLSAMSSSGRPEERSLRMERNLADLKSKFPELGLMFDYYSLRPGGLSGEAQARAQDPATAGVQDPSSAVAATEGEATGKFDPAHV